MTKKDEYLLIPGNKLFVDPEQIAKGRQRDPLDRLGFLEKLYGSDGEKFDPHLVRELVVSARDTGLFAILDGAGTHYGITHIVNKPNWVFRCKVLRGLSRAEEGVVFRKLDTQRKSIPRGTNFWNMTHDPRNKHEHAIGKIMRETLAGFTTIPGKGGSCREASVKFAYALNVLRESLTLSEHAFNRNGTKRGPIEGLVMNGLTGFLALNKGDIHMPRLQKVLQNNSDIDELKRKARRYLPPSKEHQRQWGKAIAEYFFAEYNHGLGAVAPEARRGKNPHGQRSTPRLDLRKLDQLDDMLAGKPFPENHKQVWEMRKVIE